MYADLNKMAADNTRLLWSRKPANFAGSIHIFRETVMISEWEYEP